MLDVFPPFLVYVLGAVLLPLVPRGHLRSALSLLVPVIGGWLIWTMPTGVHDVVQLMGVDLTLIRHDKLAAIFALIFSLAAFTSLLYAWHVRDTVQMIATLLYAGSAIGAVFAGDLITLFLFWEGTAIASVFLIWARRTEGAYHSGMRYLIFQVTSGVILLAGAALFWHETGTMAFERMTLGSPATWLIFLAFGIKCAFPLMHTWLTDAYPSATVTGSVVLSIFTTKLAIYALARGFAGTDMLIYIGAVMALFPIFYGMVENDLRRVLSYSLIGQLGFLVVGIGIGTDLALNGVAAHAVSSVLYKSLLFMAVGAVLYRTGSAKATELGGLYRSMPLTALLCLVGAVTISAVPLFASFATKSMILSAAGYKGYEGAWLVLVIAAAATVVYTGVKVPYAAFFGADSGARPKEAPWNMLGAMAITAACCIAIGIWPETVFALLPYDIDYEVYTTSHVVTQLQLVAFSTLAFFLLLRLGLFPLATRSVTLDVDWLYRRLLPGVIGAVAKVVAGLWTRGAEIQQRWVHGVILRLYRTHGPEGRVARVVPTGSMVLWVAILLGVMLIVTFVS